MTSSTTPEVCAESAEGADLQIPDFTPSDVTRGWTADHYRGILGGATGITKLAESAVSPLVAAARGYSSATKASREAAALELGVTGGFRAGRGYMLGQATVAGEALVMPWYSLTAVTTAATTGHDLTATTYQARPQVPGKAKAGKKSPKYLMPKGEGTVVATHPSTPMEWITGAPAFMVVEGLIKADAALTAQLRGVATYEELTNIHYGLGAAARASLTEIMGRLPAGDRCLIVEIPACWTWTEKGDWYSLPAEGREAWIGLDGDLATKNQVWSAAKAMYTYLRKKGASAVKVLALPVTDTSNGIDDFMAEGGTWSGALDLLGELPPVRRSPVGPPDSKWAVWMWKKALPTSSKRNRTPMDHLVSRRRRPWPK